MSNVSKCASEEADDGFVTLAHGSHRIPWDNVYFPFGSGRLTYDCISCGARCCRGSGYSTGTGTELLYQLTMRPQLRFFLSPERRPGLRRVENSAPACFFLGEDGYCDVHRKHGYDAKPEECRLFPFSQLWLLGDYLVVRPHAMCPLSVTETERALASDHRMLLDNMSSAAIHTPPVPVHGSVDPAGLIRLERRLLVLSEDYYESAGDLLDLVAEQCEVTAAELGGGSREGRDRPEDPLQMLELMCETLGAGVAEILPADRDIQSMIAALAPYIRSHFVMRPGRKASPACAPLGVYQAPYAVLATLLMTQLARRAGMRDVTFQTIDDLIVRHYALISTLARLNAVVSWRRDANIDISPPVMRRQYYRQYLGVAKALLPRRQVRRRARLGNVLRQHNRFQGLDRVDFVRIVSAGLDGRVEDDRESAAARPPRSGVRGGLHRLLLDVVPSRWLEHLVRVRASIRKLVLAIREGEAA